MPSVFGFVSIRPAVSGPTAARSASRSTLPSWADGMFTIWKPVMEVEAGFVP